MRPVREPSAHTSSIFGTPRFRSRLPLVCDNFRSKTLQSRDDASDQLSDQLSDLLSDQRSGSSSGTSENGAVHDRSKASRTSCHRTAISWQPDRYVAQPVWLEGVGTRGSDHRPRTGNDHSRQREDNSWPRRMVWV